MGGLGLGTPSPKPVGAVVSNGFGDCADREDRDLRSRTGVGLPMGSETLLGPLLCSAYLPPRFPPGLPTVGCEPSRLNGAGVARLGEAVRG